MAPARQAYALLRLTVGVDMLMHGLTRIGSGADRFADGMVRDFQGTFLPEALVHAFGLSLPFAEGLIGLLLVLGLLTRAALVGGSLLMIALVFGTSLRSEWNTVGLQLFYAFVYGLLLATVDRNAFALDTLGAREPAIAPAAEEA